MSTATQTVTYRCPHCQQPVDVDVRPENELLICPNESCKKPFKVEVPTAQPVADLLLPAGTNGEALPAPTAAAAPAPVAQTIEEVNEETLRVVRLQMFRRYPFRCSAYAFVTLGAVVAAVAFFGQGWTFLALFALLVGGLMAYRLVLWALRMRNTTLTITNKRCILTSGILTKQQIEVPLGNIQDIHVGQSFLQRSLNVGDLSLVKKSGDPQRLVVMAVPAPCEVACTIRDRRAGEEA